MKVTIDLNDLKKFIKTLDSNSDECEQEPFKPDWVNYRQGVEDAKREPLSDEEIADLWANKSPANEFECVRLVEKAHGIGEQK